MKQLADTDTTRMFTFTTPRGKVMLLGMSDEGKRAPGSKLISPGREMGAYHPCPSCLDGTRRVLTRALVERFTPDFARAYGKNSRRFHRAMRDTVGAAMDDVDRESRLILQSVGGNPGCAMCKGAGEVQARGREAASFIGIVVGTHPENDYEFGDVVPMPKTFSRNRRYLHDIGHFMGITPGASIIAVEPEGGQDRGLNIEAASDKLVLFISEDELPGLLGNYLDQEDIRLVPACEPEEGVRPRVIQTA